MERRQPKIPRAEITHFVDYLIDKLINALARANHAAATRDAQGDMAESTRALLYADILDDCGYPVTFIVRHGDNRIKGVRIHGETYAVTMI